MPYVYSAEVFGKNQYAFSEKRSHRDALAANVCNWLLMMEDGKAIGLYCSDVSGAFDRVSRPRILAKLRVSGLHERVVHFLDSWLLNRKSIVLVSGAQTSEQVLRDSVFQRTVLGPALWNLFYADSSRSVWPLGFTEVVFADDFNCWKAFDTHYTQINEILRQCQRCQGNLHNWGSANSVRFDAGKESFHVLRRTRGHGDDFKRLGLTFDVSLRMCVAVSELACEAGWRLQSILRPRRFFSQRQLVNLFKSQVRSYIEPGIAGYYHTAPSVINAIDRVQRRLLRELGLTEERALSAYNLAPLCSRRDKTRHCDVGFVASCCSGRRAAAIAWIIFFRRCHGPSTNSNPLRGKAP